MLFIIWLSNISLTVYKSSFDYLVLYCEVDCVFYIIINRQQNNTTTISGSIGKAADGGNNDIHSEVLPHLNNLLLLENIVQIDEGTQDVFKLTTDQFEFLNIVANTARTAEAMHGNSNRG